MDTRGCPCSQCGKAGAVLRCSRCRQTVYCDATCQRKHWKSPSAPHKTECKASAAGSSASVVPVPSSSDPENPCPICFENEDNADAKDALAGMCYNCGHFFCGECNMKKMLYATDSDSQYSVGGDFLRGSDGFKQDFKKADKYLQLAADQGHADAQYTIGMMAFKGEGMAAPDYAKALTYFKLAGNQGEVES
eukprot:gene23144-781_t